VAERKRQVAKGGQRTYCPQVMEGLHLMMEGFSLEEAAKIANADLLTLKRAKKAQDEGDAGETAGGDVLRILRDNLSPEQMEKWKSEIRERIKKFQERTPEKRAEEKKEKAIQAYLDGMPSRQIHLKYQVSIRDIKKALEERKSE
jgi:hypothetical protein